MDPDLQEPRERLYRRNPELAKWMDQAENIVYVTLGSECQWQQWYVDAFYKGLELLNQRIKTKVIVSFKAGNHHWGVNDGDDLKWPDCDKDRYWVDSWLPQIELMAHKNVKAGVTHCGLGGSLEFINSELPCMVFPHCGDQPMNATNIINGNAGLPLIDISLSDRPAGATT